MISPLWTPPPNRVQESNLHAFIDRLRTEQGMNIEDFVGVHQWSLDEPDRFWSSVWDFAGVVGDPGDVAIAPHPNLWNTRFFPGASLNYAANLLRRDDDSPALLFVREDGQHQTITWRQLGDLVSRVQQALRADGVGPGDRIAAWVPNLPEAYALLLAASSIGAVFSSCSPEFGTRGVLDRFGQIEPTVLVAADGYWYGGRRHDCLGRLSEIANSLPSARRIAVLGFVDDAPPLAGIRSAVSWDDWITPYRALPVEFEPLPFDQPVYILYSSGTTGLPKCIVHRAGGVLLKHLVEHRLHCDVKPNDRVFYFTTAGWMMWNWLASALASEATLVLYDGAPIINGATPLWNLADDLAITLFGTSAKFIDSCKKLGLSPIDDCAFAALRTITSTGSPLVAESFEYVYAHVKRDVHLASISGGTDLCGCLVAGDPTSSVWTGEIQRPGLGMAIDVFDDRGQGLPVGSAGELVCRAPFPSMPLGFWDDPSGARYRAAYYERFPGLWHQGDFAHWTAHGGIVIQGRSDATLNPGGVRIGTAEIYRQVESLDEVLESLVIGQPWDDDIRVVLFVVLRDGVELSDPLARRIRELIRLGSSPRHVPARIVAVPDLPRTRSGKLSELAVREVVEGRPVKNAEALANPEALEMFRNLSALTR
jgi:acetoacetyl-CoA synthetase